MAKLLDNLKGIFNIIAKPIKKKHIEYFNVQKVDLKLELNDIDLQFDGLFDGNAALGMKNDVDLKIIEYILIF